MDQLQQVLSQLGRTEIAMGIGAFVVIFGVTKLLGGQKASSATAQARCSCGWSGTVSRFKPACPRCARALPTS